MPVLVQFIFRLSFGLALAMACTPSRLVTSGYFRVHLYVLLGLNTLAAAVAVGAPEDFQWWPPLAAAVLSYVGSVFWLYEKPAQGKAMLLLIAGVAAYGAISNVERTFNGPLGSQLLGWLDPISGGLVLGTTIAAMFLGHWYLNTPTMQLEPLKRLVLLMTVAVILRAIVCGIGAGLELSESGIPERSQLAFIALRWLSGIVGTLILARMTWQTLKIPNTQSATGILYVAVIATFLGELTSQLLTRESSFPL